MVMNTAIMTDYCVHVITAVWKRSLWDPSGRTLSGVRAAKGEIAKMQEYMLLKTPEVDHLSKLTALTGPICGQLTKVLFLYFHAVRYHGKGEKYVDLYTMLYYSSDSWLLLPR